MAGLPKSGRWWVFVALILVVFPIAVFAQAIDPPIVGSIEEGTPSDTLADAVALNSVATEEQKEVLIADFAAAIAADRVTLDQALAMLALVSWDTLTDADALAKAIDTMTAVIAGLVDGTIVGDPLVVLADALGTLVTPDGIRNAIARAGGSEELLAQVDDLVAAGVPPGILVRLLEQAFHDGLSEEEIACLLDALDAGADGDSWGQLVNEITSIGTNLHRDREGNQNKNSGEDEGKEQEEEENQHGNANKGEGKKG